MLIDIVKISASSYLRFMWIKFTDGALICVRINDKIYGYLKDRGVKTSQYYRYHTDEYNEKIHY